MRCLYCGKDIGAFRLLRDSEFCGLAHRKNYGARLDKALHKIAAPEPPPAPVASFAQCMPLQEGRKERALALWQTGSGTPLRFRGSWPFAIDFCLGQRPCLLPPLQPTAAAGRPWNEAQWRVAQTPIRLPLLNSAPAPLPFSPKRSSVGHPDLGLNSASPCVTASSAWVEPMPIARRAHDIPPICERWATPPAAEPLASFVRPASALTPAAARFARFARVIEMPLGRRVPAAAGAVQAPAAEPVADFVRLAAVLTPATMLPGLPARRLPPPLQVRFLQTILPVAGITAGSNQAPGAEPVADFIRLAAVLTPATMLFARRLPTPLQVPFWQTILPVAGRTQSPAAEPVTDFIRLAAVLTPATMLFARRLPPPLQVPFWQTILPVAGRTAGSNQAPAAEPVADFIRLAAVLTPAAGAIALRLPQPAIAAAFEPLPVPDELMETPAICLRAMPGPAATPVCSFLQSAIASFLTPAWLPVAPPFVFDIDAAHVPQMVAPQPAAAAEPVMTGVHPCAMEVPLAPMAATAAVLPEICGLMRELMPIAGPAPNLTAEPAESLLVIAKASVPVPAAEAACRAPEVAGFALASPEPSPALGGAAAGIEPAPLESLLVASSAEAQPAKATARILNVTMPGSADLSAPGFAAPRLTPRASEPHPGSPQAGTLLPLATLSVAAPEQRHERFHPALPHPGLLPVEFHAQRSHGVVFARPEWKLSCPAVLPPRFVVRPVAEKLGEAPPQPEALRREPVFTKMLQMPAAKKRPYGVLLLCGKIAAGLLLTSSLWYGYSAFRGGHRFDAGVDVAGVATEIRTHNRAQGSAGGSAVGSAGAGHAAPAAQGPVAWVRQNIARRASLELTENFRTGMQSWGGPGQGHAAGWSRHPDGYIQTGALALFRPSLNFKDYRFEFFGQVENKGMSWSVRAKDSRNYHAMKVSVVEAGLRPFIALVHWDVIDGKAGRQLRTPLNIMVHNDRPIQVAVNVAGNLLVTSIDGEEVDSFVNDKLASGGVGFFSETNERARLYWMKVSRNDDWLGHVCAFFSDDAARVTADLWGPGLPGSAPSPWAPGEENRTFAAAWAGLPYLRAARRARASNIRRTNQWNT